MPSLDRLRLALADRCAIENAIGRRGKGVVCPPANRRRRRKVAERSRFPDLARCSERLLGEIETAAELGHPHILPLNDSGQANSFLHNPMPYSDGGPRRERLDREGPLRAYDEPRIDRKNGEKAKRRRVTVEAPVHVRPRRTTVKKRPNRLKRRVCARLSS